MPPQSESVLIQKLYTHFKKTPGSHKLGVLYVVDSVTRKWSDMAKSAGQAINSSAQDGTAAAGVHRVTELLPVLMNDISQSAPDDQKVRPNIEPGVAAITKRSILVLAVLTFNAPPSPDPPHLPPRAFDFYYRMNPNLLFFSLL